MSRQHEIGKKGEEVAKSYLEEKGYNIIEQNWRYSRAEVDIIAKEEEVLVFVEVKARSYNYYGPPEDFVTAKKRKLLSIAASAYMQKHNHDWVIRFDIISVLFGEEKTYKIQHFEDAFFLGL